MTSDPQTKNDVDALLVQQFAGKVVRKDLTKLVKEGANVPTYVLEYLLGTYCASDDEQTIREGLESTPAAFRGLFTGENIGKMLVKVSDEAAG
mgnify:CR=1 FL=1